MLHPTVKTRIIKIGNSQGIRIPKPMLEQLGFVEEVELEIQHDQLIIRLPYTPRQTWEEHFKQMAQTGDDQLLDEAMSLTEWDEREWEW